MKPVQIPSQLEKISTRADNTIKLTFGSQELSTNEIAKLFEYKRDIGWLLFSPDEMSKEDLPEKDVEYKGGNKSPSKRLRNVIYVFWRDETDQSEDFQKFYERQIERFINKIKDRLD